MSTSDGKKRSLPRPRPAAGGAPGNLPQPQSLQETDNDISNPTQTDEMRPAMPSPSVAPPVDDNRYGQTVTSEQSSDASSGSDDQRYQLIRSIARGGMGEVWLARDRKLRGRYVAVKRLTEESLASPQIRQRFESEAESMARMSHSNIIRVLDIGSDSAGPFICMEFVSGPDREVDGWPNDLPSPPLTLQDHIDSSGKLSVADALHMTQMLCSAVIEAHKYGIIHRDIKPANVLLNSKLDPVLIDFGLARDLEPEVSQHTVAGAQMLTIGYGAPEQETDASQADERADVYALGGVLWFLISGQNPRYYRNSDAPEELRAVLAGALARDRDDRIQSAKLFSQQLAKLQPAAGKSSPNIQTGTASEGLRELAESLQAERKPGVCPLCGTVHDPVPTSAKKRQFCAGCGSSLWLKCRKCQSETSAISLRKTRLLPLWERFCSRCGDDLLNPILEHLQAAVDSISQARAVVSEDTAKAHQLAAAASESLECLARQCGTDFTAGKVGQCCHDVQQEIEAIRNSASVRAASNDEETWANALATNTVEAFAAYLKAFPTGMHAEDAESRHNVLSLAGEIRNRLQQKSYESLLPDVGRLIQLSDVARHKWSDEKLSQLLKRDHSFESCVAYLNVYPEGKSAARAKKIVSPVLRKQLMENMDDRSLREQYLRMRSDAEKDLDESRAFNTTLWLWGAVGGVIACAVGGWGLLQGSREFVISGIVSAGSGLVWGIVMSFLSGRLAGNGPHNLIRYLWPAAGQSGATPIGSEENTVDEQTAEKQPADVVES